MHPLLIFISENDSVDSLLKKLNLADKNKKAFGEFEKVFKKAYNSQVGYFFYEEGALYYKIFILPKHIALPFTEDKNEEAIKNFISYITLYYKLRNKYPDYNAGQSVKGIKEVSFDTLDDKKADSLEKFHYFKYLHIIESIENFFKQHKSYTREKIDYKSQTIKHRLSLQKNIRELDKTKIHQEKIEEIVYSRMATVAYGAIKLFARRKINFLFQNEASKDLRDELHTKAFSLQNFLQKKFRVDGSKTTTLNKLISLKTQKSFSKREMHKELYYNILSLFGVENFFENSENRDINRVESESLFFDPALMYEWYVYDWIRQNCHMMKELFDIESDDIYLRSSKNKKSYFLKNKNELKISRSSEPDIVITFDNSEKYIVVDAKWKILEKINSDENGDGDDEKTKKRKSLDMLDVLKLERDYRVHRASKAFLVFQQLPGSLKNTEMVVHYSDDDSFSFGLVEVGIGSSP